jgi:protein SCO1
MTRLRLTIISVVLVAAAGLFIGQWLYHSRTGGSGVGSMAVGEAPRVAFQLTDQMGKRVDQSVLKGKWTAVFFGYTYCPDFCPLTLQSLEQTQKLMGDKAKDLQIVFISVDPARDKPDVLKAYLESGGMPKGVRGLTGSEAEIAAAAKAFGAAYEKKGSGDAYTMNHTAYVFVMNPEGRYELPLAYGLTPEQSAGILTSAMAEAK